jgi:hypothetical protein
MGAGLYRFRLHLQSAMRGVQSRTALVLRRSLYRPDVAHQGADDTFSDGQVLLDDIAEIGFRYFGQRDGRSAREWHTEWRRTDALPELIEMSVKLPGHDARGWLPLVVELKLRAAT